MLIFGMLFPSIGCVILISTILYVYIIILLREQMGAFRWFVLFISIGFFNPVVAMVVEAKRKKAMVEEEGIE
ncbi:MAG TPA: hypothetical protein QGF02_04290, partial [Candidatus Babeliales bacterium]|nr:hypothetical protein [Candidatus Babeliales bacterium]